MSRSYKKFPLFKDHLWGKSAKSGKQYANRRLRHISKNPNFIIPNGSYYKKLGINQWDLWEYTAIENKEEAIFNWEKDQIEFANGVNYYTTYKPDKNEAILNWFLTYKRK